VNSRPFIERLPKEMRIQERMTLEALGISASIVALDMKELRAIALNVVSRAKDHEDVLHTDDERTRSFLHAWSIVDHLHTVGSLLKASHDFIKLDADSLLRHCAIASDLRNWMDHAPQNIKGNISKKAKLPSLLGAISFAWLREGVDFVQGVLSSARVVITFGAGLHQQLKLDLMLSLKPIESGKQTMLPCDHFVLYASDLHLNLSEASAMVCEFINTMSAAVEEICKEKARQLSSETGRPYEEFMEPPPGRTTLVATLNLDKKVPLKALGLVGDRAERERGADGRRRPRR
jgi:hypothetical protein